MLSVAAIRLKEEERSEPPVYRAYLFGFAAVFLIILFGGGHHAPALGLALFFPGLMLCFGPGLRSLGPWVDRSALACLLVWLTAFLPLWMAGPEPWRETARAAYELSLGGLHTVQARISLEGWLLVLAGFAWLYAAGGWRINRTGRRRLMFWVCCGAALFAGGAIWGNLTSARYPGAEDATAFSYFPNRNQTANFLALAGVVGFGYAMEGLRTRKLVHLAGLLATGLCLYALVLGVSRAGVILYFLGIFIWFLFRLKGSRVSPVLKLGLPLVLVFFSFFITSNQRTLERVATFVTSPESWEETFRLSLYRDSLGMIAEAPWIGHGIGNFHAVFPQYRDLSRNSQQVRHPESDLFWLTAEGGLLALACGAAFLAAYLWRCRGAARGGGGPARVTALVAVLVFLVHSLVDVSGHRPGTLYFAILFAALARPSRARAPALGKPRVQRGLGAVLMLAGLLWFLGGLLGFPVYSGTAKRLHEQRAERAVGMEDYPGAADAIEDWLEVRPMDWRAYVRRAQIELSANGDFSAAARDFRRARFLEPVLGAVTLAEGYAWLPYDAGRAVSAWRSTLYRELGGKEGAYHRMLRAARDRPELLEAMIALSTTLDPDYRVALLGWLKGDRLMREIRKELARNPTLEHFDDASRAVILQRWISEGDLAEAEAFLEAHGDRIDRSWWFWSLLRRNQARFEEAIQQVRRAVPAESIPEVDVDAGSIERLERTFLASSRDVAKGTALLKTYVEMEDYARALEVADRLAGMSNPPAYALYWRAESLYRLGDFIESWDAFEIYVSRLNRR